MSSNKTVSLSSLGVVLLTVASVTLDLTTGCPGLRGQREREKEMVFLSYTLTWKIYIFFYITKVSAKKVITGKNE